MPASIFDKRWWNYQRIGAVCGFIATITAMIPYFHETYSHFFPVKKPHQICTDNLLSRSFLISNASVSEQPYVHQNTLDENLSRMIGHKGSKYLVLVGPKGAGKSTLINHVISDKRGIIGLSLINNDHNVLERIISEICGAKKESIRPDIKVVSNIFDSVIAIERDKTKSVDWVPTVVVEIDRGSTDFAVNQIAREIKLLCVDRGVCRGVLVLSDALAAFALPKDPRVEFVWVDDFAIDEAHQFYDKLDFIRSVCYHGDLGCDVNSSKNMTLRNHIFQQIGTRPIDLISLFEAIKYRLFDLNSLDDYLTTQISHCDTILRELFVAGDRIGMDFKTLVKEILSSKHKSVKLSSLPESELQIAKNVAVIIKEHHALMFHYPTDSYRFYSKCMENAAADWNQKVNNG
jgi:energy-coupling factor transporter ATP-binding protein EcfA2